MKNKHFGNLYRTGIAFGGVLGNTFGIVIDIAFGIVIGIAFGIVIGIAFGIVIGIVIGIVSNDNLRYTPVWESFQVFFIFCASICEKAQN